MRRLCCFLLIFLALSPALQAQQPVTAEQVIARMRQAAGVTAAPDTVDTIKAGEPATVVSGIATTISPTMAVLRRAVAAHDNLIVTHEPAFYNHLDKDLFPGDPVYAEKQAYIRDHHLVIFRWHDGWHRRTTDGIAEGWVQKAGWKGLPAPGQPVHVHDPSHDGTSAGPAVAGQHGSSHRSRHW